MTRSENRRIYPSCCTSAFCGRIECAGCPNLPILTEFKAWVAESGAKVADEVWSPTVYDVPRKAN